MGSKWKKVKSMLSKRLCMISPFDPSDQELEVSRGSANDEWAARSHSQPLPKGTRNMARGSSFTGYNTGPIIILDTYDVRTHSAPTTPPPSFSGPISSCPSRANGYRVPRSTCSICLESMKPGQGQALFTAECSHTFHFSCIASNVRHGNQICPICRAKWKDLPWQAGPEASRSQRNRNNSYRRAASTSSRAVDVGGSNTFTDFFREGRGFHNFSSQYMDENVSSGSLYLGEPDCYDDDEPLRQSSLLDFPLDRTGLGFCDQKVHVNLFSEVSAVPACESRQPFTVLVHLKAPPASIASNGDAFNSPSRASSRAPLDLVAVLDVSGSMAGRKLMLLKQAMSFVIHNLSAADRLSVVVFSSTAKRIFPLRRMGEDGQRQALLAVDALIATGGTNIAEGLQKGVKVLEECREKNPVSSIMLLSDGQDTFSMNSRRQLPFFLSRGVSDTRRLVPRSIRRSASLGRMQIPVHTFGFGSDHDAATMHTISEVSGGTFSYIQAEEVVQDAFAQCIGGLLSVVTQDVQLTISCSAPGIIITAIHSGSYDNSILDSARHGIVKLGDLYAEEERDVLVDLKLPALSESEEPIVMSLVQAACIYKDPLTQKVIQNIAEELSIVRPFAVEGGQQLISLEVDRQRNRLQTAEAIAEARSLADQGNIEAAQCGLRNARAQLGASASAHAGDRLCHVLESELNEIQERMANRQLYERSGRAYLLSAQSSHLRQRATTRGDSVDCLVNDYQTPSMVDMITLSQTQLLSEASISGLSNSGRSLLRKASSKTRKFR
ncbi:hypothetical protein L7F22_012491 [Adiantum nelumboides]|nr:hypothetical protein [Adiantum nelumboides]